MLQSYTREQVWKQYRELPRGLQDAIWSEKTSDVLYEISLKYNFSDRSGAFAKITGRILLGLIPIQKFRSTLQEELELDEQTARNIAYEVRDSVFSTVAEELRNLHGISAANPEGASPPAQGGDSAQHTFEEKTMPHRGLPPRGLPPQPPRPIPKLEGNTVNLKNFGQ